MILLVHMLFGAAIGSIINNSILAMILAFISHYFLDLFPHVEYNIQSLQEKQWRKRFPAILNIGLDFLIGIFLIFLLSSNWLIIYICAFLAIVPDGLSVLSGLFPNKISNFHNYLHQEKIHFLKYKKISIFWRLFTQIIFIVISIILLKY